jgi:hypothetical protein
MQIIRCGKCKACQNVERAKHLALKVANPPFSHADDSTVMLWNDALKMNPCETWGEPEKVMEQIEELERLGIYIHSFVQDGTAYYRGEDMNRELHLRKYDYAILDGHAEAVDIDRKEVLNLFKAGKFYTIETHGGYVYQYDDGGDFELSIAK